MTLHFFNKSINRIDTSEGTITMHSLFIPYFIEMLLMNLIGTINTIFLSSFSDQSVAAVGAASQLIGMILTFYGVVSSGASIVISQNLGAGNRDLASDTAIISVIFSGTISFIIGMGLSFFAYPILSMMNLEDAVLRQAVDYFKICISFSFIQAVTSALSAVLRSYGLPKVAVKVSILVNMINALFCYIVVFRPFETPFHGPQGIAIGSVISQCIGLSVMIILFLRSSLGIQLSKNILKLMPIILKTLRVGIPGGITSLSYSLSQVVSTAIIATIGTTAITTKIYLENIFFYVYVLGLALGLSTSIMIGRLVGAQKYEHAYQLNKQNLKITLLCNFLLSLTIFLFGGYIIRIFTDNPEIIRMARIIMLIDLFVEIGRGFNHIEANSLRGAGDVFVPMIISVTSCWTISILFSYLFGIKLGFGLYGCWIAFAMDELFRGIIYFLRWYSRRWTKMNIL